jgi:hypothetical protein
MHTRNALERLATAGRPLLAEADSLVDSAGEDRILERIVMSSRAPARGGRLRPALLLAAAAIAATSVAVVATGALNNVATRAARTGGNRHVALTGPTIQLAGYHFKTPAGFKASSHVSCVAGRPDGGPGAARNGFSAAASADGGCLEAYFFGTSDAGWTPAQNGAQPVSVGVYQGYYAPMDGSGDSALYVNLPNADGPSGLAVWLTFAAKGLTEQQLIAIAQSGLPATWPGSGSTTTGTETG